MENPFQAAALLSLDSLVISLALSQLPLRPAFRKGLPFAFGLFDGLASFLGPCLHLQASERAVAVFAWAASLLLVIYLLGFLFKTAGKSRSTDDTADNRNNPIGALPTGPLYALPLLASVDNLVDGAGATSAMPSLLYALALGGISGLASFIGFGLGTAFSRRVPQAVRYVSSTVLVVLSVTLLLTH